MEMKMGSSTASEVSRANQQHYDVENEVMTHVRGMTLAGKKKLAEIMHEHVANAEKSAKA
jgi:hypothetical protein